MRKLMLLAFIALAPPAITQQRLMDQALAVQSLNIRIDADPLIAVTVIEMEFYNHHAVEAEALYTFSLNPGQVITAFQLELNGVYRDGSIENRAKAVNAYNTIVGKRIDPAILQMDWHNRYSLRIYPFTPGGTRKIKMTIHQFLDQAEGYAIYNLPLRISKPVKNFTCSITVEKSKGLPFPNAGIIEKQAFKKLSASHHLSMTAENKICYPNLSFSVPDETKKRVSCEYLFNDSLYYFVRDKLSVPNMFLIHPKKLSVFWDVSVKGQQRDTYKETLFLEEYIAAHNPEQVVIIPFNHEVQRPVYFRGVDLKKKLWKDFLETQHYEGAVNLGKIDFSKIESDVNLLFSSGFNSLGTFSPVIGSRPVFCIFSQAENKLAELTRLFKPTNGKSINLLEYSIAQAVSAASQLQVSILSVKSESTVSNVLLKEFDGENLFIATSFLSPPKHLYVEIGNLQSRQWISYDLTPASCYRHLEVSPIEVLKFDSIMRNYNYFSHENFGLRNGFVTYNTAYIVLERIEDYVRFNIKPPKELQQQCDSLVYVMNKKNTEVQIGGRTVQSPQAKARGVVMGTEVVVTALGVTRQPKELGYSVSTVKSQELTAAKPVNIDQSLVGRVSGLNVQTVNNTGFGDTRITLRGIRSLTGNNQPLLVIDGVVYELRMLHLLNPTAILQVNVLKGPGAAALYGSEGVNGVIEIKMKKRGSLRNYSPKKLKLKDLEDEEYMAIMKNASRHEKIQVYEMLKPVYGKFGYFYYDMAEDFYQNGFKEKAISVLYSIIGLSDPDDYLLITMIRKLRDWKEFTLAAELCHELLRISNNSSNKRLCVLRELAFIQYLSGSVSESMKTINKAIQDYDTWSSRWRMILRYDLSMISRAHPDSAVVAGVDTSSLLAFPGNLRFIIDGPGDNLYSSIYVKPPNQQESYQKGFPADFVYKRNSGEYEISVDFNEYSRASPRIIRTTKYELINNKLTIQESEHIMDNQYGLISIESYKLKSRSE